MKVFNSAKQKLQKQCLPSNIRMKWHGTVVRGVYANAVILSATINTKGPSSSRVPCLAYNTEWVSKHEKPFWTLVIILYKQVA